MDSFGRSKEDCIVRAIPSDQAVQDSVYPKFSFEHVTLTTRVYESGEKLEVAT